MTWQNPKGKKSREQEPAPLLTINGETLQAMNLDDACYLGYWGTGNGDTRATKEVVRQKITAACDLIKCHPLTPKLATELFTGKGMGVFLFLSGTHWMIWKANWTTWNDCASKPTEMWPGNYAGMYMSFKNAFICHNDLKRHIYIK